MILKEVIAERCWWRNVPGAEGKTHFFPVEVEATELAQEEPSKARNASSITTSKTSTIP